MKFGLVVTNLGTILRLAKLFVIDDLTNLDQKALNFHKENMALKSSVFKANVSLSNLNLQYYDEVSLTLALHPSETEQRLMFRLIAYLYCASERLEFTIGLNDPDLPDIWAKDLTGQVEHWIELGFPDDKKIRKAIGRSNLVSIFTYNRFKAKVWLDKVAHSIKTNDKVQIYHFDETEPGSLEAIVKKSMSLNCVIEDQQIFLSDDNFRAQIDISCEIS